MEEKTQSYEELLEELQSTEMQLSVVTSAKFDRVTEDKVQTEMSKKEEYAKGNTYVFGPIQYHEQDWLKKEGFDLENHSCSILKFFFCL